MLKSVVWENPSLITNFKKKWRKFSGHSVWHRDTLCRWAHKITGNVAEALITCSLFVPTIIMPKRSTWLECNIWSHCSLTKMDYDNLSAKGEKTAYPTTYLLLWPSFFKFVLIIKLNVDICFDHFFPFKKQ